MKNLKRLLVISEEGSFSDRVNLGIQSYCLQHGGWETHWEPSLRLDALARIKFALKRWKAHGVIAQIGNLHLEQVLKRIRIPVVNFSSVRRNVFATVWIVGYATCPSRWASFAFLMSVPRKSFWPATA
jgi:hypothetical protein